LLDVFGIQGGLLDTSKDSYYPNITGFIHGDAAFRNLTVPSLASDETLPWKQQAKEFMAHVNTTNMTDRLGSWNWTATTKIALSFVEKKPLEPHSTLLQTYPVALVHVSSSHDHP
jgi:transmembrane E3 ubiquitin-protein ligase